MTRGSSSNFITIDHAATVWRNASTASRHDNTNNKQVKKTDILEIDATNKRGL